MPPSGMLYHSGVFVNIDLENEASNNGEKESNFETAINYAGMGKFQNVLLGISGAIYATCAISTTTLSFVLPSAKCDFDLTSADKGKLSAMPLAGMLFGCCLWGSLANSQGRKTAIMSSLLMDFFAAVISSFAKSYPLFLICRFFNGFGIIGATSLIFSYLGEFLSVKHRDKYMGKLEIFWNVGVIILPGVAWSLLSKKTVQVFEDGGDFSPWRIFVLVCSLPSLISVVLIYFLPETPKYLLAKGKYSKAKLVFQQIYAFNTGEKLYRFPVQTLEGEGNNNEMVAIKMNNVIKHSYRDSIVECYETVKTLLNQQYFKYLTITCLADFGLMASYYTLIMWFPEIFDRFSDYKEKYPDRSASVCLVSQVNSTSRNFGDVKNMTCNSSIENKVFLDTLVIGLSCIPTSASLSYFMYKIGKKSVLVSEHEPATFEEAITATKFGKYNIMLAFLAMLASFCTVFDTSTMSYTFVAAQCDLKLSLSDKGLLNAVTYAGMISSAVIWGFLFDVLGRRKLLIFGFLVDAIFVFTSAISQSLPLLLVSKYLQGLIINGPFAALSSYISEFHSAKYRPIYQMIIGSCNSFGTVLLPLIAWAVLPQNLDFTIINLDFHSWNVFLLISGLPAFFSGMLFLFFPESPKFLMTCGENDKALNIFKKVYTINTGQPPDTFPIRRLVDETKLNIDSKHGIQVTAHRSKIQALKEGFQQIKPIFFHPHRTKILLTCSIMFFVTMGMNMLRLWLPQIFQIMRDYQLAHDGESASLCTMLATVSSTNNTTEECVVNTDNATVYINSIIVGSTAICGNVVAGTLIRFIGKKRILIAALISSGIFSISMYFANVPELAIAFSSIFIAGGSVSNNVMVSVTVDLFPTTLRTMAIALGMMIGRIGAMSGNFLFPYLLESGCEPPFFVVGGFMLAAAALSFVIPNTDMKALT